MKSPHVFHVYHTIPTSFFWGQGQSQASHQQDRHGAPGLPFRTFRAPGLPRTAQFTRARGAWHGRGQKWVKMVIYWWKDVERCGKMWKNVERCGKMWKDVESEIHWKWNVSSKVGRCWKSQLENGAIRLHRKIVSSSFLMVKPPHNRWFKSQTMQHPFCLLFQSVCG